MSDHSLLKTPGEMILEAREAQELTIAQLSERTKIPPAVLAALEMDEFHKISGPLYIKSFLRTCALDLGLNPQTVLNQYEKISGETKSGPVGKEMVWKEEEVLINRVGLPWLRIVMGVGIVAILVGVGLFALRGCGGGESLPSDEESGTGAQTEENQTVVAVVPDDSASTMDSRRESLMPASTEADLRERAEALEELELARDAGRQAFSSESDSLAVGWLTTPPPAQEESEPPAEAESASDPSDQDSEAVAGERQADTVLERPVETTPQETSDEVTTEENSIPEDVVEIRPEESSLPEEPDEITSGESQATEVPVVISGEASPAATQMGSAWPLVLRIVCDAPQEILVKRDGDSQFSSVRWPDDISAAAPVPAAGFEAGRAYRDGQRLVVFWGADDHFSLKLARVGGVEVSINGRVRDVGRLRPGQELILDAHTAGAPTDR